MEVVLYNTVEAMRIVSTAKAYNMGIMSHSCLRMFPCRCIYKVDMLKQKLVGIPKSWFMAVLISGDGNENLCWMYCMMKCIVINAVPIVNNLRAYSVVFPTLPCRGSENASINVIRAVNTIKVICTSVIRDSIRMQS